MKGDVFLLKGYTGAVFVTIDALRATSVSINGEVVNVTSKSSPGGFRQLLSGGGVKSMSITAEGVWGGGATPGTPTAEQKALRTKALDGIARDYQIADSDQVIEGSFVVTNFELSGPHGAEQTYSVTLESADLPVVT
ncbi:MAG: phage tail protein [Thermoleophilia bacterium]|nr:phage tail protein [Thermoleophilia bacterium]